MGHWAPKYKQPKYDGVHSPEEWDAALRKDCVARQIPAPADATLLLQFNGKKTVLQFESGSLQACDLLKHIERRLGVGLAGCRLKVGGKAIGAAAAVTIVSGETTVEILQRLCGGSPPDPQEGVENARKQVCK